jgi:uncharacterized delta-60 repeat protein
MRLRRGEVKRKTAVVIGLFLLAGTLVIPSGEGRGFDRAQKWVARYDGLASLDDKAAAIAVDKAGNVYVVGESVGTLGDSDYAIVKYNAAGRQLWTYGYNGPAQGSDRAVAVAVDASGNIFVTGDIQVAGKDFDIATIKYGRDGRELWVRRYDGPGAEDDEAAGLALDASGNVYVAGSIHVGGRNFDFATIKYDTNGKLLWAKRYDGPNHLGDWATAMALDKAGRVVVTGESTRSGRNNDYATVCYDADGTLLWEARYNGPGNAYDRPLAVAADGAGGAYVTGYAWGGKLLGNDAVTIHYDGQGQAAWLGSYDESTDRHDEMRAIAVDGAGNVYATGDVTLADIDFDIATIKYNRSGRRVWAARYGDAGKIWDVGHAVALDRAGNVYVTGVTYRTVGESDYITIKYNAAGKRLWLKTYQGPGKTENAARAIAVDAAGNVYVTGESVGNGTGFDFATIKY